MEITLIITAGVVLATFFAAGFDYLTKRRKKLDNETKEKVTQLEKRVKSLEASLDERGTRIEQIESDLTFYKNLIEKK